MSGYRRAGNIVALQSLTHTLGIVHPAVVQFTEFVSFDEAVVILVETIESQFSPTKFRLVHLAVAVLVVPPA